MVGCFFILEVRSQERLDIVITEIFADPSPVVGLPNFEWIEIKNRSASPANLQGWRLADASSQSGPFPTFILSPDSSLIVCGSSAFPSLSVFGAAVSVTSFPSLDNEGDLLAIRSSAGKNIHALRYNPGWHKNELKAQGGWSLEMIDTDKPCLGEENWKASIDPAGGTPGKKNSINAQVSDLSPPILLWSYAFDNSTLRVVFNEPLDSAEAANLLHYEFTGNSSLVSVLVLPPLFSEVELKLSNPIDSNMLHTLKVHGIKDCEGNLISNGETLTGLASFPEPGDWIINEILFDPPSNGYDYVEFFNRSGRILNLAELFIANRNSSGAIASITALSPLPRPVFPGEYVVVTENTDRLQLLYLVKEPAGVLELGSLPSYPDDEGSVIALDSRGIITDEVHYEKEWHFRLINQPRGVSLEKLDPAMKSQDPMNWHSASSTAGYGTPGYVNSQFSQSSIPENSLSLQPNVFSPDNDGRDDVLKILYELPEPGYMVSIQAFDLSGRVVRIIANNQLAGIKGAWTWDGLDNKGMKLPLGLYVICAELFNLEGKTQKIKLPVAIVKSF